MRKFRLAVWCFLFIRPCSAPHRDAAVLWILQITESLRRGGGLVIGSDELAQLADWFLDSLDKGPADLDTILTVLIGDAFFDRNKRDIARLEKEAGRSVFALWDTDPIFSKYPQLRGLGRNKDFEENVWAKIKQKQK